MTTQTAKPKLLITGAGGFVGSACVKAAVTAGHEVVATIRPGGSVIRYENTGATTVQVELSDRAALAATLEEHRPDVVVHAAWSGVANAARHSRAQIGDNIDTAVALVEAAAANGVQKFVGIGSQAEYGLLSGKISETALPVPTSLYGAAKLAVQILAAQLCADAGMQFAWLRLFSTYGPQDNPHWLIPSLINQMLDGRRPMTTEGRQLWDYLYIDDVAAAIVAVAEREEALGVFNLGSGQPVSIRSVVETVRDIAAPDLELTFGEVPYRSDQVWHMEADIGRLAKLAEFFPRISITEGIERTVAWHKHARLQ